MKSLIKIVFIFALLAAFSSCSKTETAGFEDAEMLLKNKVDNPVGIDQITEEEQIRLGGTFKSGGDLDDLLDDSITDDDEDDDEGSSKSK